MRYPIESFTPLRHSPALHRYWRNQPDNLYFTTQRWWEILCCSVRFRCWPTTEEFLSLKTNSNDELFSCRLTQDSKVYLKTNLVTLQFLLTENINCNTARKSVEVKAFAAICDRSIHNMVQLSLPKWFETVCVHLCHGLQGQSLPLWPVGDCWYGNDAWARKCSYGMLFMCSPHLVIHFIAKFVHSWIYNGSDLFLLKLMYYRRLRIFDKILRRETTGQQLTPFCLKQPRFN